MRSPLRKDLCVYDFNEDEAAVERQAQMNLLKFDTLRENPNAEASPIDRTNFLKVFAPHTGDVEARRAGVVIVERDGEHQHGLHAFCTLSPSEVHTVVAPNKSAEEVVFVSSRGKEHRSYHDNYEGNKSRECVEEVDIDVTPSDVNWVDSMQTSSEDEILVSSKRKNVHDYHDNFERDTSCGCFREGLSDEVASTRVTVPNTKIRCESQDCNISEHPSNVTHSNSDGDDNWTVSSSCHSSDQSGNEDSLHQVDSINRWNSFDTIDDTDMEVVVSPDYVIYGDKFYDDSQLIFSPDCIRIKCLEACESNESFTIEWAIEDVIHIDSLWSHSVETAWIEVWTKPTIGIGSNGNHNVHGNMSLVFTVLGQCWMGKEQKIISLAPRYKDVFRVEPIARKAVFPEDFVGLNPSFTTHYLKDFQGSFEDVVYPEGDPDAVSVSQRDIELLQPETFINDTIIDFYIKYLKNQMKPEDKIRFHFFNSFFFRKLADLDKDPQSRLEGRAAFLRVHKWTRKVDIFQKDYILIPVNFNLHWSLLVICHPGEIADFNEKETTKSCKVPCILHMDSMKGNHDGLKSLMQSYLWEEWKERHPDSPTDLSLKFSNLRFITPELPQQENMYDCGLFLLHYVELFLKEAPINFSPFSIMNLSNFLNIDWFVPTEASFKRFLIRNLLYDLLHRTHQDGPLSETNNDHLSGFPKYDLEKEQSVDLLSNHCYTAAAALGGSDSTRTVVYGGIELELWTGSSSHGVKCGKDGVVERQFFVPEATAGSCLDDTNLPIHGVTTFKKQRCTLSPIEEGVEPLPYPDVAKDAPEPLTVIATSKMCSASYASMDFGVLQMTHDPRSPEQVQEHEDGDSFSETNSSKQCLSKTANEYNSFSTCRDALLSVQTEETGKLRTISMENRGHSPDNSVSSCSAEKLDTCVVEDSQEVNTDRVDLASESENAASVLQEKYEDVQESGTSVSGGMLETCAVEDCHRADANEKVEMVPFVSPEENGDVPESPLASNSRRSETCIVKDSQEDETNSESNDQHDSLQSCQNNHLDMVCPDVGPVCNVVSLEDDDSYIDNDNSDVLSDQRRCKRRKVHTGVERMQTRSLARNGSF